MQDQHSIPVGLCQCGCGGETNLAIKTRLSKGHVKGEPLRFLPGHRPGASALRVPYKGDGLCECGCGGRTNPAKQNDPEHGHVLGHPMRFVKGHSSRVRFAATQFVEEDHGYATPCWIWQLYTNPAGYGILMRDGDSLAHRVYYKRAKGPIPEGLELDHLCRVTNCVNPDHLEAVTPLVNTMRSNSPSAINARKTHCIHGHALSGENLRLTRHGGRVCRTCQHDRMAEFRERRRRVADDAT